MTSCYRILGVCRSATEAEIRAAYIRLIKQHHPDRVQDSARSASRDINHAYAVLKDATRRAEHDRTLGSARLVRPAVQPSAFQRPPARRTGKAYGVMMLCFSIALVAVALEMVPSRPLEAFAPPPEGRSPSPERLIARQRPIDVKNVSAAVRDSNYLRSYEPVGELVTHSRYCFAQLTFERTVDLYDYCVAFDHGTHAALRQKDQLIPYFMAGQIDARHRRVSGDLFDPPHAADVRLRKLEKAATGEALSESSAR